MSRVMEESSSGRTTSIRKIVAASSIGTIIEWYDFYLFGTAVALAFFSTTFFPSFDPVAGTLAAFATFTAGFIARPLGGFILGHLGDKVGRKAMLVITLLLMGFATFAIGILPSYASIGITATILLVVLRLIQGFSTGGEWGGAALMAIEHSPSNSRGFYGSFVQIGVSGGFILANGVFLGVAAVLSSDALENWGWRIPFLLSIVLVLVGLFIRLRVDETPVFAQVKERGTEARLPIVEVFRTYPKEIALTTGALIASSSMGSILNVFVLFYTTQVLGLGSSLMLSLLIIMNIAKVIITIIAARLSDQIGRKKVVLGGAMFAGLSAFPFFWLIDTGSASLILIALIASSIGSNAMYGPLAALFAEMYSTKVRYTGVSAGYQFGGILGAGLAPLICTSLYAATQTSLSISFYILVVSLISFVSVYLMRETYREDLEQVEVEEIRVEAR